MITAYSRFFASRLLLLTILTCQLFVTAQLTQAAELSFEQHNEQARLAWEQEEYQQALEHFLAASSQRQSAALHHNIGNTLIQLDQPGLAIAHYRKSLAIDPTHPDTRSNLNQAYQKLGSSAPATSMLAQYAEQLPLNRWIVLAAIGFWCSAASLLLPRYLSLKPAVSWTLRGLFLTLFVGAIIALGGYHKLAEQAIVISDDTGLKPSPTHQSQAFAYLHQGESVRVQNRHGDFTQVLPANGRSGWVENPAIVRIWDIE